MKEDKKEEKLVQDQKEKKSNKKIEKTKSDKTKKENSVKKEKKQKNKKEKKDRKPNKFIEIIKKKWLVDGTKATILVLAIVAVFVAINVLMQKLELTPIDFSQEKLYTLTDESKESVKNIDKDINIYFIGYDESDTNLDLAKQYKKANEKINVEAVDANNRPDLVEKYGIESGTQGIIIECGDKSKVLTEQDLVTYDTSTYETISIAEEKLTSGIKSVTTDKVSKVYFLEGYSDFSLGDNMNYLNMYLGNEINEVNELNVLSTGKIPDDCDTLVITNPNKDFDDVTTSAILDYIKSGKNILWLNAAVKTNNNLPNVNEVLAEYGIKPFEVGVIRETDSSKMVMNSPSLIIPKVESSTVTKDLYNTTGVIFINATKINVDTEKLEELNVEEEDLITTSENSYFRTNFNITSETATADEEKGSFVVGAEFKKTIKEEDEENNTPAVMSKMIVYGENYFISDYQLSQNSQYGAIQLAYNKDLMLNSIAYLVDREEDITARKSTGTVTYTATDEQDIIIRTVIFSVPALIIFAGIVVWQVRRRKK